MTMQNEKNSTSYPSNANALNTSNNTVINNDKTQLTFITEQLNKLTATVEQLVNNKNNNSTWVPPITPPLPLPPPPYTFPLYYSSQYNENPLSNNWQPPIINNQPPVVNKQPPIINNQPPVVNNQLPVFNKEQDTNVSLEKPNLNAHVSKDNINFQELNLTRENQNALEIMCKFFKLEPNVTIINIMLQYFLIVNCKVKPYPNWITKKEFTASELLICLFTNPAIFGEDEASIYGAWTLHLREYTNAYKKVLVSIYNVLLDKTLNTADNLHYITVLSTALNSKDIMFKKSLLSKKPEQKATEEPFNNKNIKKPNVKFIVKTLLDKILIQFMDKALSLNVLTTEEINDLDRVLQDQFVNTEYAIKCKNIIESAVNTLSVRTKLAEEKRLKRIKDKTDPKSNVIENNNLIPITDS